MTRQPLTSDAREVSQLLASPDFTSGLDAIATRLGRAPAEVREEASAHLRELSATHNDRVTAGWQRVGRWMLRGFDRLTDEESMLALRALDHEHSLIFLISHRSYLDEWAVPPVVADFGIAAPFGLAGANLDFFPLGTIARRTGIIHIRRSTADMPVYKFALRSFMGQLVTNRSNLIWSIEGGRTRTGKLRPPRLGLLRYVIDALDGIEESKEVYLVPVSIQYDQLPSHEVELMASEARGNGKTPENARWFFDYLLGLRKRIGRIYVDFGEPLPLRSRLADLHAEDPAGTHSVERVALELCHRINLATPVTPTAIVCGALLPSDRALTLDQVLETVTPLATYLERRGWPTAGAATLNDRGTIRRALQDLVSSGVVTSFAGKTTVWRIAPEQHLIASVYRNSAIHTLVPRAIAEVVLSAVEETTDGTTDAWALALRLRELLKFEFFFASRSQFATELQKELELVTPVADVASRDLTSSQAQAYLDGMDLLVAPLVLRPFLDAYAVVADQLLELGTSSNFEEERFMERCLQLGEQWALQKTIGSAESASAEMFRTALRLARYRGIVDVPAPDLLARRQAFVDDVDAARRQIGRVSRRARRPASAT
ncbi:MAG: glycerol-3-phosphate O-acyltransferase [Marmoricola sp.]|nr:glycerol-3-phosphate O-acyltransferase [Marmoricola sp.]